MNKNFKYNILLPKQKNYTDIILWCDEVFGNRYDGVRNRDGNWMVLWAGRENFGHMRYSFCNEQDFLWFKLRWL